MTDVNPCCTPAVQATCCEAADKAACCESTANADSCGCAARDLPVAVTGSGPVSPDQDSSS
jgi:hypothetical protein